MPSKWLISLLTTLCFLAGSPLLADDRLSISQDLLSKIAVAGDISILDDTKPLLNEIDISVEKAHSPKDEEIAKILIEMRVLRSKVTKRSPAIRTLIENLRALRSTLPLSPYPFATYYYGNPYVSQQPGGDVQQADDGGEQLTEAKSELDDAQKEPNNQARIEAANKRVQSAQRAFDAALNAKRQMDIQFAQWKDEGAAIDEIVTDATKLVRNLDERLSMLDEASESLLQSNIRASIYTDRSTWIFAVLVGGVIIGFFAIAFMSSSVREAIFTGDSGIQFVTLFSLVIAIILFGVLHILEGRELAALLGGLSGYILGKGTQLSAISSTKPDVKGSVSTAE